MLIKDPCERIEVIDICQNTWVTNNDQESVNLDLSEASDLSAGHTYTDSETEVLEVDL